MSSAHYHTPHTRLSSDPLQRSIVPWRELLTPDTWAGDQVHMVRNSSSYVGWKERKAVAADLKTIYRPVKVVEAEQALGLFELAKTRLNLIAPVRRQA